MVELGAIVVCISSCFHLLRGPSVRVLIHLLWNEEMGEAMGRGLCVLLRWFLYLTEDTLYSFLHDFCSSSNDCSCTRNIGGPLALIAG